MYGRGSTIKILFSDLKIIKQTLGLNEKANSQCVQSANVGWLEEEVRPQLNHEIAHVRAVL